MNNTLNIAEIFYDTGEIKFRYSRIISEDGLKWIRDGLFCEYHKNGKIISEGKYVEGKEGGLWRDYYPDGGCAAEGFYDNGVEVGEWKYWDMNGERIEKN